MRVKKIKEKMGLPVLFHRQACVAIMVQTCSLEPPSHCSDKVIKEMDEKKTSVARSKARGLRGKNKHRS